MRTLIWRPEPGCVWRDVTQERQNLSNIESSASEKELPDRVGLIVSQDKVYYWSIVSTQKIRLRTPFGRLISDSIVSICSKAPISRVVVQIRF